MRLKELGREDALTAIHEAAPKAEEATPAPKGQKAAAPKADAGDQDALGLAPVSEETPPAAAAAPKLPAEVQKIVGELAAATTEADVNATWKKRYPEVRTFEKVGLVACETAYAEAMRRIEEAAAK